METNSRQQGSAFLRSLAAKAGVRLADDEATLVRKMTEQLPPNPDDPAAAHLIETLINYERGEPSEQRGGAQV